MLLKWTILEKRVTKNWLSVINAKVFYHYRANIAIKLLHFLHLFLHFSFFWVYIFFYIFGKIFYTFWQKVSGHPGREIPLSNSPGISLPSPLPPLPCARWPTLLHTEQASSAVMTSKWRQHKTLSKFVGTTST